MIPCEREVLEMDVRLKPDLLPRPPSAGPLHADAIFTAKLWEDKLTRKRVQLDEPLMAGLGAADRSFGILMSYAIRNNLMALIER
jgi:hypothetical protein